MMRRLFLRLFVAILLVCFAAHGAIAGPVPGYWVGLTDAAGNSITNTANNVPVSGTVTATPPTTDPCQTSGVAKSSVAIAIGTATTTEIVAAVAAKSVFVCGYTLTLNGTAPSLKFITGTKTTTACDTGPANLTGTFLPIVGAELASPGNSATNFSGAVAGELCVTTAGTVPSAQGYLTYVQQ